MPGASAYLVLQLSPDKQHLYISYAQISKERKFDYYVTKMLLAKDKREELQQMVASLAQAKISMQKTPITIDEDLAELERESEEEIKALIAQMEKFFKPVSEAIETILNPERDQPVPEMNAVGGDKNAKGGKKEEVKKAPAKAPKGRGATASAQAEVAAYESPLPLTTSGIESVVICVD